MRHATKFVDFRERSRSRERYLEARFADDYPSYQYIFVEFFLEHLSEVSRVFNGDLQQMLVLALVGQVQLNWIRQHRNHGRSSLEIPHQEVAISASRLSDCSGIPRETVRRKLASLQQRGWVDRSEDGRWFLAGAGEKMNPARESFSDLDLATMRRIAAFVSRLEGLADEGHV